jgi:hypothetical protein
VAWRQKHGTTCYSVPEAYNSCTLAIIIIIAQTQNLYS